MGSMISWIPDWLEVVLLLVGLSALSGKLCDVAARDWTPKYRRNESRSTTGDTSPRT